MRYYGIDLHSDSMTVAVQEFMDGVWRIRTFSCSLFGAAFQGFLDRLQKEDLILVEATTVSFWFYDQVIDRVEACYILNTHQLDRYGNKTDKIDAKRLVRILTYNEQMEPELQKRPYIYVPAKEVRDLRALFTTYSLTKKMITQIANRIHSLYKQNGEPLERKKLYSRSFPGVSGPRAQPAYVGDGAGVLPTQSVRYPGGREEEPPRPDLLSGREALR